MKKQGIVLLMLTLGISCSRIKEEPAPWGTKQIPVVYSLLTPDSVVKVLLTSSYSGTNKPKYPSAKAFIANEATEIQLTRHDSLFFDATHAMKVQAGKKYELKIDLGDGSTPIKAYTTVPHEAAHFSEFTFIPLDTLNELQQSGYFICQWTIPASNLPTDTYRIYTSWGWDLDVVKKTHNTFQATDTQLFYPLDDRTLSISLFTTDVWLGRFLLNTRFQSQQSSGTDITGVLLREFSGVLPGFSNVENGLGLFGSYRLHTRDLKGNILK